MKGVLLLCGRVQDEPHMDVPAHVALCLQCRVEVWVSDSGLAAMEPHARAAGMEVLIVCVRCGGALLREADQDGEGNARVEQTPDQLRDSFERRMQAQRRQRP